MKKQVVVSTLILTFVFSGLGFMVLSTNPDAIGPTGITVFFFLIFIGFFVLFDLVWRVATHSRRQPKYNLYIMALIAGIPTMLLALQSLNQLQIRDVLVVVVLAATLIFYLAKRQQG